MKKELSEIFVLHHVFSEECMEEVSEVCMLQKIPKRTVVLRQGDICRNFYLNRSGLFRVSHLDKGAEDTICFGTAGDVFTSVHSLFRGEPSVFSLVSIVDSEIYVFPFTECERLSQRFPDLVMWMRNLLIEQIYAFERRYLFFGHNDAETRYRNFIGNRGGILRNVPVKYIAQYLQIAPEYLSRIRRRMMGK